VVGHLAGLHQAVYLDEQAGLSGGGTNTQRIRVLDEVEDVLDRAQRNPLVGRNLGRGLGQQAVLVQLGEDVGGHRALFAGQCRANLAQNVFVQAVGHAHFGRVAAIALVVAHARVARLAR
jgi:hypothetical protein